MEYQKIISQIRNRMFHPVYLLFGEEPFYIDLISDAIEQEVLQESEKEFNQTIVYGSDVDVQQLLGIAKRYPMMSSHMVVIVREAQLIKNIEELQPYFDSPLRSTILVLCYKYKKPDKRKTFYKSAQKAGVVFESEKLKDFALPGWIISYVRDRGYQISEKNAVMIAEHLGNDLNRISNELGKVFISLTPGMQVSIELIEKNIGISKDFNFFELQKAIGSRDIVKANRIVLYFGNNPKEHPMPMLIAMFYSYFSKLLKLHFAGSTNRKVLATRAGVHEYYLSEYLQAVRNYSPQKLIRIIEHIRVYDMKSKGIDNVNTDHSELLKELLFKILH